MQPPSDNRYNVQHSVDFPQTEDYKLWNYKFTLTWKFNKRTNRYHGENSTQEEGLPYIVLVC